MWGRGYEIRLCGGRGYEIRLWGGGVAMGLVWGGAMEYKGFIASSYEHVHKTQINSHSC